MCVCVCVCVCVREREREREREQFIRVALPTTSSEITNAEGHFQTSNTQVHKQDTSNAQLQLKEISSAQARRQETYKCLQINKLCSYT